MSIVHIASPLGDQSRHEEDQLRTLWEQGLLHEGSLYWMEGMTGWRPIGELFQPQIEPRDLVTPPVLPTPAYSFTKDPRLLTAFLVVMLWICIGIEVLSLLGSYRQMSLLDRSFTQAEAEAQEARQRKIGLAQFWILLVTGIAFLKWIYRANLNCRGFGANGMRFTPGWAVGWYFVPILNLVMPYQSMAEIWKASHDPRNWNMQQSGALLNWWWALWLAGCVAQQLSFRMSIKADSIDDFKAAAGICIFADIIAISLCLVTLNMVETIAAKQEHLVTDGQISNPGNAAPRRA